MTPDNDLQRRLLLTALTLADNCGGSPPEHHAAAFMTNWPESQFYGRADLHKVAAEIASIRARIEAEKRASA
jgi:hypothetical protein